MKKKSGIRMLPVILCLFFVLPVCSRGQERAILSLLPAVKGWKQAETPLRYFPATLFEYIDGAAESYLSYDFKELLVGQYKAEESSFSLTVEIYDMGSGKNAFGIYSVERFTESRFLDLGVQGYSEEGALNFFIGRFYIKLLCFECGAAADKELMSFARAIEKKVGEKGKSPDLLQAFPKEGLIANSEKFILRNFLGYKFLHGGYLAKYKLDGQDFDGFMIEAANTEEAAAMFKEYLANLTKESQKAQELRHGFHLWDRYALNIYVARSDNLIFGVMRIKDGSEEIGKQYLEAFIKILKK